MDLGIEYPLKIGFHDLALVSVPHDVGASIVIDDALVNLSKPLLIQSEPWFGGHFSTKSGRTHHQRESSLSSMSSAGPVSLFNPTISSPHIAVTNPGSGGSHDVYTVHDNSRQYHAMPKPLSQHQNHLVPGYQAYGGFDGAPISDAGSNSVASSTFGGDSPVKPSLGEAPLSSRARMAISPTNELFAQRLQAANSQHLSATQSPISASSSDTSPFRQGSPFAPALGHEFGSEVPSRFTPREENKTGGNVVKRYQAGERETPPQTISPKDVVPRFRDENVNSPLFPPEDTTNVSNGVGQLDKATASQPQQHPFIARAQPSQGSTPRLVSEPSASESSATPTSLQKPRGVSADGGTYTCTYHGCTLRFETPALLQKHKREGHRQAHGLNSAGRGDNGANPAALGSQAGPHKCDRINPSTGKPCNVIFSRPYDLTRHEDTIHNARKQKLRCDMCTEEKTFSRADALTRHYRVSHPDVEFPGKHRTRGGPPKTRGTKAPIPL